MELGPGAVVLVYSPVNLHISNLGESINVGGNAIILYDRWGPALIDCKSDLSTNSDRLHIDTHSPFSPRDTDTYFSSEDPSELRAKQGPYHRFSAHQKAMHRRASPVQHTFIKSFSTDPADNHSI